jgi:Flp pilus assembly protein TadD
VSVPASAPPSAEAAHAPRAAALALVLAGVGVYANALRGPFLFDDASLWLEQGLELRNRPLVRASFALNRYLGQGDTLGYHALNVLVHVFAGLCLFALVRRTLRARARPQPAGAIAFGVALLWLVHPLQTESVAYISQRAESLAGLCVLAALLAFARAFGRPASARARAWQALVFVAFALGMATKEVAATLPLLVLLYDRAFLAGSFAGALRARPGFYAALAASALALGAWFIGPLLLGAETSGFALEGVTPLEYARTQAGVVLGYLGLAFAPRGLCLDRMAPVAHGLGEWLPHALVLVALLAATAWALARRPALGFVGAWFFVTLAPSSSVVPIQDLAVEHRMYLPLAAPLVLVVLALFALAARLARGRARLAPALVGALALALGLAAVRRNRLYQDAVAMWTDVVTKAPHNWRGHLSLGMALLERGDEAEAARALERSLELEVRPNTYLYLGRAYSRLGDHERALAAFDQADHLRPLHAETLLDRGIAYLRKGDARALVDLQRSAALEPTPTAFFNLGVAALNAGDGARAEPSFRRALELLPDSPQAVGGLGRALYLQGRTSEAVRELERALALRPDDAETRALLEQVRAASARPGG